MLCIRQRLSLALDAHGASPCRVCTEDAGGTLSASELSATFLALLRAVGKRHFCACIGSPCLRKCVHGASIGRMSLSPPAADDAPDFAQVLTATVLSEADVDASGELDRGEFIGAATLVHLSSPWFTLVHHDSP
eukprot:COSAG01_NODE_1247_length_11073_cov_23.273465_6_plen_134_part_00